MVTAMQEMIKFLKNAMDMCHDSDEKINFAWVKFHAELLLQKEKEQIMDAWYNGFDELRPYVDHSEEYYNKTYKQNDNNERVTTDNDRVY